jgi:S-adenosylmethionine decarboxylase
MLEKMIAAANAANVRIVHSYVEEFDGEVSPTGFAAMVLLDESHISAHCYYDKGWLAVDAFTCGGADPNGIADDLHGALTMAMDDLVLIRREEVERFLYDDLEES